MTQLLIVCRSNICRSPMAQVVTRHLSARLEPGRTLVIESAGTHAARHAEPMDPRAQAALVRHGYTTGLQRSRPVRPQDFLNFDWILAMDSRNLTDLHALCPPAHQHKLRLFLSRTSAPDAAEVPDPYYGNAQGFDEVLKLCETGARSWLTHGYNSD